jgi:hypothetical protein
VIDDAYLASSAIAAFASLSAKSRRNAGWWLVVSIGIVVIGMLRIVEAALWMDDHLRRGLLVLGWYHYRRVLQIGCIAAFGLAFLSILKRLPRPSGRLLTFAVAIFYVLALTMAIRSSSLHWADAAFRQRISSVNLSEATQVLLLLAISLAALFELGARLSRHEKEFG